MLFWVRILSVALLTLLIVADGWAIEIIYPADKTIVNKSNYLIIKTGNEKIQQVTVAINGIKSDLVDISSAEYRKYFQDLLILRPDFDAGLNKVDIEGYSGGKVVDRARASIFYRTEMLEDGPAGFQPFVMHVEEREQLCVGCHNMNPDQDSLDIPGASQNPCGTCHQRSFAKKHVHGPAGVWECGTCHDATSRPQKYQLLVANVGELCGECHDDKIDDFRKKPFVHGPVAVGECTLCHDAHASEYPSQMVDKVINLCRSCHSSITEAHVVRGITRAFHPLEGPVNPYNDMRPFDCSSCHDPHSGESKQYFAKGIKTRFSLCSLCHKK
jgi:predicted CXXCH cytochrome family protein